MILRIDPESFRLSGAHIHHRPTPGWAAHHTNHRGYFTGGDIGSSAWGYRARTARIPAFLAVPGPRAGGGWSLGHDRSGRWLHTDIQWTRDACHSPPPNNFLAGWSVCPGLLLPMDMGGTSFFWYGSISAPTAHIQQPGLGLHGLAQQGSTDFLVPCKIQVTRLRWHNFQVQQFAHNACFLDAQRLALAALSLDVLFA